MLILDKVDFRPKKIYTNKGIQALYKEKKESIQQDTCILNMYISNNITSKYLKQKQIYHLNTPINFNEIEIVT